MTADTELFHNDLVMYVGNPDHSVLKPRIVYRVIDKELSEPTATSKATLFYRLQIAFDVEHPMGSTLEPTPKVSVRGLKRMSLLDLGTVRMLFDEFIKAWSRSVNEVPPPPTEPT